MDDNLNVRRTIYNLAPWQVNTADLARQYAPKHSILQYAQITQSGLAHFVVRF
jgi:hypothetical protein